MCADLIVGTVLKHKGKLGREVDDELREHGRYATALFGTGVTDERRAQVRVELRRFADQALETGNPDRVEPRRPFHWLIEFPEVFFDEDEKRRGFDAVVGNPPFIEARKITGPLGVEYREYLVAQVGGGKRGTADICAYFFLRAREVTRSSGGFGLLATNTIAQGDTREVGLDQIVEHGDSIARAVSSRKWPGTANLEVVHVWVRRGEWRGRSVLDEREVATITSMLSEQSQSAGRPFRLKANEGRSFQGSNVLGMGFVLTPDEAQVLIAKEPRNREVVFPYLNGEDLNSRPDQSPSRWVINFQNWPIERAEAFPDAIRIVEQRVKPERDKLGQKGDASAKGYARLWWQYARRGLELYSSIAGMERVLVTSQTGRRWEPALIPSGIVYSHSVVVFALHDWIDFALMQAVTHEEWRLVYGPTLRTDARYTSSDCFETFPFPSYRPPLLVSIGEAYHSHRQRRMLAAQEGLTTTYNRFHNSDRANLHPDIQKLRDLHVELDRAVAAAYDWSDHPLDHGFHATKQGERFTVSPAARKQLLARLLALNHARYADELAAGLHAKKKPRASRLESSSRPPPSASTAPPTSSSTSPRAPSPASPPADPQRSLFGGPPAASK